MINRAVAWHSFQQHHWIRISLLGLALLFVYLFTDGNDRFPLIQITPFLVWVLGSGIIGRDISSGVAHLLFTRPIARADYILTKWVSLTAAVWFFQCLVLLVWCFGKWYYDRVPQPPTDLMLEFAVAAWMAATLSTVVVLFSTIMSGMGDLALLLYIHVILLVLNISHLKNHIHDLKKILVWILYALWPGVRSGYKYNNTWHDGQMPVVGDFVTDSAIALLFLAAAVFLMSRKEIGYTND
jgi:ABC-type transport system involved in multi-copper enzyme maturation permease subunit